ncbi:MAG: GTP-binding protein [Clostridium sp.]|jgi:G3E family GTPase|nr:GTP-binding protein [Clostridium sp.]
MTKIDVVSGFLGAGKTTFIQKLLQEALGTDKVVLIENEFGEIGIDGGFLKEAGIAIKEMNSGCICCSLVGDFDASLKEVLRTYSPQRVLIEPSGVGKLSDVLRAVENVARDMDVEVNSAVTVVDALKCRMYLKNFGEFFQNQVAYAGTVVLSRTDQLPQEKLKAVVELLRGYNEKAAIVTTPWEKLDGQTLLETMEGAGKVKDMVKEMLEQLPEEEQDHGHYDPHHACGQEEAHHHGEDHHREEAHHHGEGHHHEEAHHHGETHHHEEARHHHGETHHHEEARHHHGETHHHEEARHHHEEAYHRHGESHHHHTETPHDHARHHHADEVFTGWGIETPASYTKEELRDILTALDSGEYGNVLRAKGMVPDEDGTWIYFDYVPQERDIRAGKPDVTGKICVIGEKLKEEALAGLFRK